MSDNVAPPPPPPPPTVYIDYPLANVLACELCNRAVRADLQRQKSVFRADSRRHNYVRHLRRQHALPGENVKIRCSACGRVSEKPSRSAWRDAESHHKRVHAAAKPTLANPVALQGRPTTSREGKEERAVQPEVANEAHPAGTAGTEKMVRESQSRPTRTMKGNDPPVDGSGASGSHPNEPEQQSDLPSKSIIVSAMGPLIGLVVDYATDPRPEPIIHSTPKKSQQQVRQLDCGRASATASFLQLSIVPKARPPIGAGCKRTLSSPSGMSPRKRFQPA